MGANTEKNRRAAEKRAAWLDEQDVAERLERDRRRDNPTDKERLHDEIGAAGSWQEVREMLMVALLDGTL